MIICTSGVAFHPLGGLTAEEGIAIHIVNEIAQGIVLIGSDKSYGLQSMHGHLAHACEDVFTTNADTAAHFVGRFSFSLSG